MNSLTQQVLKPFGIVKAKILLQRKDYFGLISSPEYINQETMDELVKTAINDKNCYAALKNAVERYPKLFNEKFLLACMKFGEGSKELIFRLLSYHRRDTRIIISNEFLEKYFENYSDFFYDIIYTFESEIAHSFYIKCLKEKKWKYLIDAVEDVDFGEENLDAIDIDEFFDYLNVNKPIKNRGEYFHYKTNLYYIKHTKRINFKYLSDRLYSMTPELEELLLKLHPKELYDYFNKLVSGKTFETRKCNKGWTTREVDKNFKTSNYTSRFEREVFTSKKSFDYFFEQKPINFKLILSFQIEFIEEKLQTIEDKDSILYKILSLATFDEIYNSILGNYIFRKGGNISLEEISQIKEIFEYLNSTKINELHLNRKEFANKIFKNANPYLKFMELKKIFENNALPDIGKIYLCWNATYENFGGYNFTSDRSKDIHMWYPEEDDEYRVAITDSPVMSKTYREHSTRGKNLVLLSDMLRLSLLSENLNLNEYLDKLVEGNETYLKVINEKRTNLTSEEKVILTYFSNCLEAIYSLTYYGMNKPLESNAEDLLKRIEQLYEMYHVKDNGNIVDRIVSMFCYGLKIKTLAELRNFVDTERAKADKMNRENAKKGIVFSNKDLVKYGSEGTRTARYFLTSGGFSHDLSVRGFMDTTPLDSDFSILGTDVKKMIRVLKGPYGSVNAIGIILDAERLTNDNDRAQTNHFYDKTEYLNIGLDFTGHYGTRTGFAATDIKAFVRDNYRAVESREIAKSNLYIPVENFESDNIIFTPEMYDNIRKTMNGFSKYGFKTYNSSASESVTEEIEEIILENKKAKERLSQNIEQVQDKVVKALENSGKVVVPPRYLSCIPHSICIEAFGDKEKGIFLETESLNEYKFQVFCDDSDKKDIFEIIKGVFPNSKAGENGEIIDEDGITYDFFFWKKEAFDFKRFHDERFDKFNNERDKELVQANIILGRRLLIQNGVSKENVDYFVDEWILQHGGSFYEAAKDFLSKAMIYPNCDDFKMVYPVLNYSVFPRDFEYYNELADLTEDDYKKICDVLKKYVENYGSDSFDAMSKEELVGEPIHRK